MQLTLVLLVIVNSCAYHHEGDYWVKFDKGELIFHNKSYMSGVMYKMTFHNRTQKLMNFEFDLIRTLHEDMKLDVQVYKFLSNEYRFFPVTLSLDLCAEYKRNTFGVKDMLDKYSNIRSCPTKKGHYYLRSAVQDYSAFPPLIPGGMYKIEEKYSTGPDLMWAVENYYTITEFIKKWEN